MRVFLNWSTPLLRAASAWLLGRCEDLSNRVADLGGCVVVVRGRSAGRRLLALLAAESQRAGRILVPPIFTTPGNLHEVLFEPGGMMAGRIHRRLAWTGAIEQAEQDVIREVWRTPGGAFEFNARALAGILDQTWQDLGASGADFRDAIAVMERVSPDLAEFEGGRWRALASIEEAYHRILKSWGMCDPSAERRRLAREGAAKKDIRVVLVGIVELAPALVQILHALPSEPSVLVHAPESYSAGFDDWGRLDPAFWAARPCRFDHGEIHVVRDAREQAERCAEVINAWQAAGLSSQFIAIAAPEPDSIPAILDGLSERAIPARAAQGHSAARTALFELLSAMAGYLDRADGEPPLYSAAARLLRHPDLAPLLGDSINNLDSYFEQHLPWRIGDRSAHGVKGIRRLRGLVEKTAGLSDLKNGSFAEGVTTLLLRVYGRRRLNRNAPDGRPLIHALGAVCSALDEMKAIPPQAMRQRRSADLLRLVIEIAGGVEIPGAEMRDAIEVSGWLEAAADDAPGVVITSAFEGSLPEGAGTDPLFSDFLRKHLGLPCRASRYARDQYTLWAVRESRRDNGRIAVIAPRRDAAGVPVRPSRLLVAAHDGDELAARLLWLTTSPGPSRRAVHPGPGFMPPAPDPALLKEFRVFPVTGFRTFLASPRLFYLKHVLGLKDRSDTSDEMDGGQFGTVMHSILATFGERWIGRGGQPSPDEIHGELQSLLADFISRQFGADALPPVRFQVQSLRERLGAFASHQARMFEEGWRIIYVENPDALQVPFTVPDAPADVRLRGKIDRIDLHPERGWRVIDYKTSAKAQAPLAAHYGERSGQWRDLQLPLYLQLLSAIGDTGDARIIPGETDLVYFNLPPDSAKAGITPAFPRERCDEALHEAWRIVREVCSGTGCEDAGNVHESEDPAFLTLCGLNGFPVLGEEEE